MLLVVIQMLQVGPFIRLYTKLAFCGGSRNLARTFGASQHLSFYEMLSLCFPPQCMKCNWGIPLFRAFLLYKSDFYPHVGGKRSHIVQFHLLYVSSLWQGNSVAECIYHVNLY